ncbi:MAG: DUF4214 domain-containing protein [Lachnospiraceae bacterium]|nr:DUF4214 domain-containing protein [Lachnospiraceae bacterium]
MNSFDDLTNIALAKDKIRNEAQKLVYTDWFSIRELDGEKLLAMEKREFIQILYKAVLKRPAMEEDLRIMLGALDDGNAHRIDIIDSVQASEEAKLVEAVTITGLEKARRKLNRKRRLEAVPILGYILGQSMLNSRKKS